MKKTLLILLCLGLSIVTYSNSFGSKNYRFGGTLYYASEIKSVGIGASGSYIFTEAIEGAASLSYVLKNDNLSWFIIDADAHYIFHEYDRNLHVYAFGGVSGVFWNYYKPAETIIVPNNPFAQPITIPEVRDSGFSPGINIGAGVNYKLADNLMFMPEFKFTVNDNSFIRLVLNLQYIF